MGRINVTIRIFAGTLVPNNLKSTRPLSVVDVSTLDSHCQFQKTTISSLRGAPAAAKDAQVFANDLKFARSASNSQGCAGFSKRGPHPCTLCDHTFSAFWL